MKENTSNYGFMRESSIRVLCLFLSIFLSAVAFSEGVELQFEPKMEWFRVPQDSLQKLVCKSCSKVAMQSDAAVATALLVA